ncbi:MAG TPA: SRPBCC family protein [Burkholderiaceae bacterium]|jgi:carbon monoxide dehydrogenase subunit G|nr:SRPBCC family protein [Burkholderiaceae bacterium]
MAITVPFDLGYEFQVKAKASDVFALLSDVPASASHFPKLAKLVDLGDHCYRWEMEKVGTASMNIQTVYASRYVADKKKGTIVWTPVEGEGNALVSGSWTITDKKTSTHIVLAIKGELQVPLPAMMKKMVAPFVVSENEKLVEKYIDNLIAKFGGEV